MNIKTLFAAISAIVFVLIFKYGNPTSKTQEIVLILSALSTIFFSFISAIQNKKVLKKEEVVSAKICGHKITIRKGSLYEDKKHGPYKIELKQNSDYCFDCIKKSVITCPWCKGPIFPDEPITLYSPSKNDYEIPEHTHVYKKDPLTLVGCARCADTGADYSGFWVLPGKVERKESMLETAMNNPGKAVLNNNLTSKTSKNQII